MRAVLCRSWGPPEALTVEEVPPPPMIAGGVRIAVRACGVNFADTLIVAGKYQEKPAFPFTPGLEVAGEVIECAAGATRFRAGDRVMAVMDHGAFAEEVVVPESAVFAVPPAMDFVSAAAFPVTYGTSHLGLTHRAGLRSGETLLVHGAAGGVGLTAVEIGKALGATVIATAGSPQKLEIARAHGADYGIDYGSEDIKTRVREITEGRGADVVYDPVGGDAFDASLRCIAWEGRLVVIGFASGRIPQAPANLLLVKNCAVIGLYWGAYRKRDPEMLRRGFTQLARWYEAGQLRPLVSHRFPMERVADALSALTQRRSAGKVVIETGTTPP